MNDRRFPNPIFVALDTRSLSHALALSNAVRPYVGGLKVGLEFVNACGPEGIRAVTALNLPVFVDVKLHDIPNTVAGAIHALAPLGAAILNVHTFGGTAMMKAAAVAAAEASPRPLVIGVTVLTSLSAADLAAIGVGAAPLEQVTRLARLAAEAGLDGVVSSPHEVAAIRAACGPDFLIVTPGVRPAGAALGDQQRVMTPRAALDAGSDILVIGRPITEAADPAAAAKAILADLKGISHSP